MIDKHMISDEFGNMYNEDSDNFYANIGNIYTRESAEKKIKELRSRKRYQNWNLKLWNLSLNK